jgi:4-amino-4-deoxy-L-arabinose transferase-like glycosyltransferase
MALRMRNQPGYRFGLTGLITLGLSLLSVWPTLVDPHWGLYDDATTLTTAQAMQAAWQIQELGSGRYRPAYFLYYALQYRFFGTAALGYYVIQALVLMLTNLVLYGIVRVLTGSRPLAWFAVLIFLTSSSMVENYHTLSKAEPRLVLFLLVSLYCFIRADRAAQSPVRHVQARRFPRLSSILWAIASGVSLLLAALTKETALIVLPAALLWALLVFGIEHHAPRRPRTAAALQYCALNALVFSLFALAAYGYQPTPLPLEGGYTGAHLSFVPSLNRLVDYMQSSFDAFLLVGLATAGTSSWLLLRPRVVSPTAVYALLCVLCAVLYASVFTFVWQLQLAYYLLPVAAWTAIAISLLTKVLLIDRRPRRVYTLTWLILALPLALARAYSIPAIYNGAVALKTWDRVNAQMVHWVASLPKATGVFFSNYHDDHEYLYQLRLLLALLYHRSDIVLAAANGREHLLQHAKPGDILLLNFGGLGNRLVWVRGVQVPAVEGSEPWGATSLHGFRWEEAFRTRRQRQIFLPLASQSASLVLGWVGYRITQLPHIWLTTYDDGWVGREAELWIADNKLPATVVLSGQGLPTLAYPMHLEIWARSDRLERLPIWSPGAFELRFPVARPADVKAGYVHLRLVSDKTFIPMQHYGGSDARELSVIITSARLFEGSGRLKNDSL